MRRRISGWQRRGALLAAVMAFGIAGATGVGAAPPAQESAGLPTGAGGGQVAAPFAAPAPGLPTASPTATPAILAPVGAVLVSPSGGAASGGATSPQALPLPGASVAASCPEAAGPYADCPTEPSGPRGGLVGPSGGSGTGLFGTGSPGSSIGGLGTSPAGQGGSSMPTGTPTLVTSTPTATPLTPTATATPLTPSRTPTPLTPTATPTPLPPSPTPTPTGAPTPTLRAPTNLRVLSAGSGPGTYTLGWDAPTNETVVEFRILSVGAGGEITRLFRAAGSTNHTVVADLDPSIGYSLAVTAVDTRGRETAPSNTVATVGPPTP
jgi:hypothetical protein